MLYMKMAFFVGVLLASPYSLSVEAPDAAR